MPKKKSTGKAKPGQHPNSRKNLKPVKPGEVRNPSGRPKGQPQIPALLDRLLNETEVKTSKTHLEAICDKLIAMAIDGDKGAAELLFGRKEGGIMQNMKHTTDDPLLTILEKAAAARGK